MGKVEEHNENPKRYSPERLRSLRNTKYPHENSVFFYTVGYAKGYKESHKKSPKVLENNDFQEFVRKIAEELCEKHPQISTYEGVFKGKPHLKETRFTVADVLSAICIYENLDEVIKAYGSSYSEEQFKAAIRYARDFLLKCYSAK